MPNTNIFQLINSAALTLKVSANKRFLVTADGQPFFWLGDTAWELFHRSTREEAEFYLQNRARLGFNVVQIMALSEIGGVTKPNSYGHLPLIDRDPARPAIHDEAAGSYWDHVDFIVGKANELGIVVGLVPAWGCHWGNLERDVPIFTRANAESYGEWLGRRYQSAGLVWILGGDRVFDDEQCELMRALARGLRRGDGGTHLMTVHPRGGHGSAEWFHDDEWLDFNMRQNGHGLEFTDHYDQTRVDYDRRPIKPVFDGEPIYEGHPVRFNAARLGHSIAADVRRALYWDLFGGAFGHTYGHHSVWQMWHPGRTPVNAPLLPWKDALDQPGAVQMQYARRLVESRPFLTRVPDDSVIVEAPISTFMPGAGMRRFAATRDEAGRYAMVYAPVGQPFKVRMDKIGGSLVKTWWFNPRDGSAYAAGEFGNKGEQEFISPNSGELLDWVLVLDDAAEDYPCPGTRQGSAAA